MTDVNGPKGCKQDFRRHTSLNCGDRSRSWTRTGLREGRSHPEPECLTSHPPAGSQGGCVNAVLTQSELFSPTWMLRSCDSCLRSALVLCCRPCRWSCICRRDTETGWLAPKEGGGIRARGADGVRAAQPTATETVQTVSIYVLLQYRNRSCPKVFIQKKSKSLKFWQKDSGQFLSVQQLKSQRASLHVNSVS